MKIQYLKTSIKTYPFGNIIADYMLDKARHSLQIIIIIIIITTMIPENK